MKWWKKVEVVKKTKYLTIMHWMEKKFHRIYQVGLGAGIFHSVSKDFGSVQNLTMLIYWRPRTLLKKDSLKVV